MPAGHPPICRLCGAKGTRGDATTLNKIKIAFAAALVIGTASAALAAGHVTPGSTDGVNPVYHPRWFPQYGRVMRAYDSANQAIYSGVDGYFPNSNGAYAPARALARHIHHSQR
jgi:hypothetical protein